MESYTRIFKIFCINTRNKTQKLLKLKPNEEGYVTLGLFNKVPMRVHRLVAITFLENLNNKKTVNHKNHIRHDNRLINLEWSTHTEQNCHKGKIPLNTGGKTIECYLENKKIKRCSIFK
jgi:hypothetical protein